MSSIAELKDMIANTAVLFASQKGLGMTPDEEAELRRGTLHSISAQISSSHVDLAGAGALSTAIMASGFTPEEQHALGKVVSDSALSTVTVY